MEWGVRIWQFLITVTVKICLLKVKNSQKQVTWSHTHFVRLLEDMRASFEIYYTLLSRGEGVQKVIKCAFELRLKDKHNIWMVPYLIQKKVKNCMCGVLLCCTHPISFMLTRSKIKDKGPCVYLCMSVVRTFKRCLGRP